MPNAKENREIWLRAFENSRDLYEKEILPSVDRNRKGDGTLCFTDGNGAPLSGKTVTVTQTRHDFHFGAHLFMLDEFESESDREAYRALFPRYFNLATVPFYWDTLEPAKGHPRFGKDAPKVYRRPSPDLCLEYCEKNGIDAKLHCLVYDRYLPPWLPKSDMAAMEEAYEKRVSEIARRYRGRFREIEVINETLMEADWTDQSAVMNKRDLLPWAFSLAQQYFPGETLMINECNQLCALARQDYRNAYFLQLEGALLAGVPIGKIGVQHHIFTGATAETPEQYEAFVRRGDISADPARLWRGLDILGALGLPVELTEVTIPTFGTGEEDENLQADLTEMLYTLWFAHPAVDGIVYWNTVDGYAYDAKGWHENNCRGGIFRHDLTPKQSALTLDRLLNETWHTGFTAVTDREGKISFRGFYGNYTAETEGIKFSFSLHKGDNGEPAVFCLHH